MTQVLNAPKLTHPWMRRTCRRATVKEIRALLLQLSAKADRYSSALGQVYAALYIIASNSAGVDH